MKTLILLLVFSSMVMCGGFERDLMWAVKTGDLRQVRQMLEEEPGGAHRDDADHDLDFTDSSSGNTPLIEATVKGHVDIVEYLIREGADPDEESSSGKTALIEAIKKGNDRMIRLLIGEADIDQSDANGVTPLMHSLILKDSIAARLLIDAGADVNARDTRKCTPLMYAVSSEMPVATKLLVSNGAQKHAENDQGLTAFDVAKQKRNSKVIAALSGQDSGVADAKEQIQLFRGSEGAALPLGGAAILLLITFAYIGMRRKSK